VPQNVDLPGDFASKGKTKSRINSNREDSTAGKKTEGTKSNRSPGKTDRSSHRIQ